MTSVPKLLYYEGSGGPADGAISGSTKKISSGRLLHLLLGFIAVPGDDVVL